MKRLTLLALAVAAALLGVAAPAQATEPGATVRAICDKAWYVNGDEGALKPKQTNDGLLFDGPSLIHRAAPASTKLTPAAEDGAFTVTGAVTGVKPLFKMETGSPYSTVNKTGDGKFWRTGVASGPGSQAAPVDHLADLIGTGDGTKLFTADTIIATFGVGYANGAGNKALVSSVTFGGKTYSLACKTKPQAPRPSATPATHKAAPHPGRTAAAAAGGSLPVTGPGVPVVVAVGAGVLLVGAALFVVARRRKTRFTA